MRRLAHAPSDALPGYTKAGKMRFAMQHEQTTWQRISERAWQLIVHRDVDLVEVTSGVLMFGWGMQLLMPWETFRTGVGYQILAHIAPEHAWGVVLSWIGATQVMAYLLNHWHIRLISALFGVVVWTFLAVAFGMSNPYGTGIIVYPFLALVSMLVFWRVRTHRMGT